MAQTNPGVNDSETKGTLLHHFVGNLCLLGLIISSSIHLSDPWT